MTFVWDPLAARAPMRLLQITLFQKAQGLSFTEKTARKRRLEKHDRKQKPQFFHENLFQLVKQMTDKEPQSTEIPAN